jgi:hypothetical protein
MVVTVKYDRSLTESSAPHKTVDVSFPVSRVGEDPSCPVSISSGGTYSSRPTESKEAGE